jgi:hypothetical protein
MRHRVALQLPHGGTAAAQQTGRDRDIRSNDRWQSGGPSAGAVQTDVGRTSSAVSEMIQHNLP